MSQVHPRTMAGPKATQGSAEKDAALLSITLPRKDDVVTLGDKSHSDVLLAFGVASTKTWISNCYIVVENPRCRTGRVLVQNIHDRKVKAYVHPNAAEIEVVARNPIPPSPEDTTEADGVWHKMYRGALRRVRSVSLSR
jgi:hypothetical protein